MQTRLRGSRNFAFLTTMLYFWVEKTDLAWMESNVIGLND